jgi:hypothetical protein
MAVDVASLAIRVESLEAELASRRLNSLSRAGGKAERATDGLTGAFARLVGPLAASVTAAGALVKLISTQREFDVLNASLITATGSAENAAVAFDALRQFAANTPYDLNQTVDAFNKLVNLGLTPSEAALESYGNTASAMGKELSQLVEAVADASTGEFERLKEFGIKAKQEGDRVTLTFRGVKTEIGNNAAEIEQYLIALGQNEFAGAMARRMDSLDGALSNLGDAWDQLFLTVSQSGVGDAIETAVRLAIGALEELTDMIQSGQLAAAVEAIGGKFDGFARDFQATVDFLVDVWRNAFSPAEKAGIAGIATSSIDFIVDSFRNMPENIRAFIQILTVEFAVAFDQIKADAVAFRDGVKAVFNDDTVANVMERRQEEYARLEQVRVASIEDILRERDASVASFDAQIAQAKALRAEYEKNRASRPGGDQLAQFSQAPTGPKGESDAEKKAREKGEKEFAALQEQLRTEEEAIQASYEKRMEIIRKNTEEGSRLRADLEARTTKERDEALAAIEDQQKSERDSLYASLLTEEEALKAAYDRKKDLILESTTVTEMERQDLLRRLEEQFAQEQQDMEMKRIQGQLAAGEQLFSGLAGLAKSFAGEQSKAYRALFAVQKAFSVTSAAMSIATGIAEAQKLGFPANLAEMARVASVGASVLSQINGSNFSGAYDTGGNIPAGKIGLVGEYGPELVRGPANVTSRKETADMFREGGRQQAQPAPVVNLRNVNVLDPSLVGDYLATDDGERLIMNVVQKNQGSLGL